MHVKGVAEASETAFGVQSSEHLATCGALVNLIELGPPEMGKTFAFRSLSSYGFVVSGSNTTVASLFYNKARRKMGLVGYRDCILFDEIAHSNFRDERIAGSVPRFGGGISSIRDSNGAGLGKNFIKDFWFFLHTFHRNDNNTMWRS